ncbi:MAG: TlpA family protein disulfide reductase [Saprospiraceae bacterium]|nr:TlpA family protein disulfide reductase [Saprospiraceae bacterium]
MKKLLFSLTFFLTANAIFAQKALPNVELKTLEGKTVNVKTLAKKNKATVLSFWATWCAPCKKEMDAIKPNYAAWQKKYGVEIIAITIDDAQGLPKVKPMIAQKGWKYRILSDMNRSLMQSLGFQGVPYTILLDKNGKIVYEHNGYTSGDEIELEKKIAELN